MDWSQTKNEKILFWYYLPDCNYFRPLYLREVFLYLQRRIPCRITTEIFAQGQSGQNLRGRNDTQQRGRKSERRDCIRKVLFFGDRQESGQSPRYDSGSNGDRSLQSEKRRIVLEGRIGIHS